MHRLSPLAAWLCAAPAALALQSTDAPADDANAPAVDASRAPQPVSFRPFQAVPPSELSAAELAPYSGEPREGFAPVGVVPAGEPAPTPQQVEPDDSIPLPNPAVFRSGENGDVLVSSASGDPYFLGFAAGPYYPPAGERIDPALVLQAQSNWNDGRPSDETYAFAMFSKRITPQRVAEIEELGARVLQFHPHYALKLALPAVAIDAVAAHEAVRWIGVARPWQKVHPELALQIERADPNRPLEVWIDVFESDLNPLSQPKALAGGADVDPGGALHDAATATLDHVWRSNGWMQRALEDLGVEVLHYDERIHAHRGRMLPAALELVVMSDFVQFVEWDPPAAPFHEESMTMVNADDVRSFYDGGTNERAVVGIVDSGVEAGHSSLNHIFGGGLNLSGAPGGNGAAWNDDCGHGSHVAGTLFGDAIDSAHDGVARGAGWGVFGRVRNVRIFATCSPQSVDTSAVIDHLDSDYVDGSGNHTHKPHVINNSFGSVPGNPNPWVGTEAVARLYDDNAYSGRQLNVFAAGNDGSDAGTMSVQASAKNVLTVGNVFDYGTTVAGQLSSTSSRGPTGDGRWKPNVVAPGNRIESVDAATSNGTTNKTGTSMAAPHVAGLITCLIDSNAMWSYTPARIAAQVMATAHRSDDTLLTVPSATHLDEYGAGRVDGTRAIWSNSTEQWTSWTFFLGPNTANSADFTVPSDATRLVAVMHYMEPAASSGASKALINDFDMYLDQPPLSSSSNSGEWFAQQSSLDNTEIRVLDNPIAGTWRWKIHPDNTTTGAFFGLSIFIHRDDAQPLVSATLDASAVYVRPNEAVDFDYSASTPASSATGLFLATDSGGNILQEASTVLKDGSVTDLIDNQHSGRSLMLGNLSPFFGRTAHWQARWVSEGSKIFVVTASGDNFNDVIRVKTIFVDGTPPPAATNLDSTTHTAGAWSNETNIAYSWTAPTDNVSGIDGYAISTTPTASMPPASLDIGGLTSHAETLSDGSWFFNLRAVDRSGNWSNAFASAGPYGIDTAAPTAPGPLSSPTHQLGVLSCDTVVTVSFTPATDALSGLAGYFGVWDTSPTGDPVGALNMAADATSRTRNIGSSSQARYFHLRAQDLAGNWGPTRHFGPVFADSEPVVAYCTGKTNSLGCVPAIGWTNAPSISAGTFTVTATQIINQKLGHVFWGLSPLATPFQGGFKCVAAPTRRTPNQMSGGSPGTISDCTGTYAYTFASAYLQSQGVSVGDTLYAQWWMRDPASPSSTGLSDALSFTWCP